MTTKEESKQRLQRLQETLNRIVASGNVNEAKLTQSCMLTEQILRDITGERSMLGDNLIVQDYVVAYYGTPETPENERQLIFASKGHIVNQGLIMIVNILSGQAGSSSGASQLPSYNWASKTTYMRVGTGGSVTTGATTNLTSIVSTAPDSQAGATSNPSGTYRIAWTATWNASTLTAIDVSEIGLWLGALGSQTTLQTFGTTYSTTAMTAAFFSRLSDADGDFTTFTVNTAVPLTIEWRLTLSFA